MKQVKVLKKASSQVLAFRKWKYYHSCLMNTPTKDRVTRFGDHVMEDYHWTAPLFPVTDVKFKTFLWWLTMSPDPDPDRDPDPDEPSIGFPGHSFTYMCHIARNLISYIEEKEEVLMSGDKGVHAAPEFLLVIRPYSKQLMAAIGL